MSVFDSLAVAIIVLWSIVQVIFGGASNRWRQTTPLRLKSLPSARLPHSHPRDADERFLMIATTYERFPLGARPFGRDPKPGLKFGIIDRPRRWLMVMLPLIAFGLYSPLLARFGAHRLHEEIVEMTIADSFIMDGESFPAGRYILSEGPAIRFVVP